MSTPPFIRTGLSCLDILLVLFIGLKIAGHLDWHWLIVVWPAYVIVAWWIMENVPRKVTAP